MAAEAEVTVVATADMAAVTADMAAVTADMAAVTAGMAAVTAAHTDPLAAGKIIAMM